MKATAQKNGKKVLFFISGPAPSKKAIAKAEDVEKDGATVYFRNAAGAPEEGTGGLESYDGVCGAVPPAYVADAKAKEKPILFQVKGKDKGKVAEPVTPETAPPATPDTPPAPPTTPNG